MIFEWLTDNYILSNSGIAWGYNFPWANTAEYVDRRLPTVVATSFVVDGLYSYWKITKDIKAKNAIIGAAQYVKNDIPIQDLMKESVFRITQNLMTFVIMQVY